MDRHFPTRIKPINSMTPTRQISALILILGTYMLFAKDLHAFETNLPKCLKNQKDVSQQIVDCSQLLANADTSSGDGFDIRLKLMALYTKQGSFPLAHQIEMELENTTQYLLKPLQEFNFLRRRGILAYHQGQLPKALFYFNQAVNFSRKNNESLSLAKALSDTGTAHLAMMQYPAALKAYRSSLAIKEKYAISKSIAVTLNNIGSVYRKMSEWKQAEYYYTRAMNIYTELDKPASVAHTRENLGLIFIQNGELGKAISSFMQSLTYFQKVKNNYSSMRLLVLLANVYLLQNDLENAETYLAKAESLELILGTSHQSTSLKLNLGIFLSRKGHYQQAEAMLLTGLDFAKKQSDMTNQLLLLKELTNNAALYAQWNKAFDYQIQLTQRKLTSYQQNFDESLARNKVEFEYEQQQKAIALLNKDNQIKKLELTNQKNQLVVLSLSLLILAAVAASFILWQWRRRNKVQQELEQKIAWHQQQFVQLGISHNSLKMAFGQLNQAIIIINNKQQIIFVNESTSELFNVSYEIFTRLTLAELIEKNNREFWDKWNSEEELQQQLFNNISMTINEHHYCFELCVTTMNREEPIAVLLFSNSAQLVEELPISEPLPVVTFHQQLVDLMFSSVTAWEVSTGSTKVELAEKSGIWRVSIDDGRLRTRSLDRYMSLKLLPKQPRWREVLRTAHFVLAECELAEDSKLALTKKLEQVSLHIRAEALI